MKKLLFIALIITAAFGQVDTSSRGVDSVDTLVDTLVRTTVSTFTDTLVSVADGVVDTIVSKSRDSVVDTVVDIVDKVDVVGGIDTVINAITDAIDTTINKSAPKKATKIFLLPSYTIHIFFLAVCLALIAATLYYFFVRRDRDDTQRFLTTTRLSVLDKLVQRACRYVEANYPDPALTPEAVCNNLVTGKAYLDALFMNELGINVQDFIVQVRVNAIKNRLSADHTVDIAEICAECGFADRDEAERCFATVCGGVGIAEFARFSKMQNQKR